jgi:hypothetical protein
MQNLWGASLGVVPWWGGEGFTQIDPRGGEGCEGCAARGGRRIATAQAN